MSSNGYRVVALLPVFNDAQYLPGWFDSVGSHVDAVIALDDGSTDESAEILSSMPQTSRILRVPPQEKRQWDEPANRERLVRAGQEIGAEWFVAFDADERPSRQLWERWDELLSQARRERAIAIDQPLREVWDSPKTYRDDGVWGRKRKTAIFRNLGDEHLFDPTKWHGEWYPAQYLESDAFLRCEVALYHLKMLRREDRFARMRRYKELDPRQEFQSIGYDYLADETGLHLSSIAPDEDYEGKPEDRK